MNKGLIDELGSPRLYNSSLYEYMPIFRSDPAAKADCVRMAYSEMLLSGVTTVADLSMPHDGWLDLAGASERLRVCLGPMFRSGGWRTMNGHVVEYDWDEPAGEAAMAEGAGPDRCRAGASVGPAVRHGGAGADRHLHRRVAA